MSRIGGFYKPEILVFHNGHKILYEEFHMDSSEIGNVVRLFLKDDYKLQKGDVIEGRFSWQGGTPDQFFACLVDEIYKNSVGFELKALSSYLVQLRKKIGPVSWRSTTLKNIFGEILNMAGCQNYSFSFLVDQSIDRFSIPNVRAAVALENLFNGKEAAGQKRPVMLVDPYGKLLCGSLEKTRVSVGKTVLSFGREFNIIKQKKRHFWTWAYPVLFNQIVEVEGRLELCIRSLIFARPGLYRLGMEVVSP